MGDRSTRSPSRSARSSGPSTIGFSRRRGHASPEYELASPGHSLLNLGAQAELEYALVSVEGAGWRGRAWRGRDEHAGCTERR